MVVTKTKKIFKFARVKVEIGITKTTYWALYIENLEDLMVFLEEQSPNLIAEYFKIKKKRRPAHCTTKLEGAVESLFLFGDSNRKTLVDDIAHIDNSFSKPKIRMVLEGKKLLINTTGIGFCPYDKDYHTILEVVERDSFNFPDWDLTKDDIDINRWPGGSHYYVKVGTHRLGRFNTVKFAQSEANKYLKKLQREKRNENRG